MVSFFPFLNSGETNVFSDSLGIWIIGNHAAIRMAFGPEHLNFERKWPLAKHDRPLNKKERDEKPPEPYQLHTFATEDITKTGPGYVLNSYIPKNNWDLKELFIQTSLTPVHSRCAEPYVCIWHELEKEDGWFIHKTFIQHGFVI